MKVFFYIKKFFKIILLLSIISMIFSYWQKDKLPDQNKVLNSMSISPQQVKLSDNNPFTVTQGEFTYHITPKYSYEIYGLIVTQHDSRSWIDLYHKNDPYNTKDICVLWGNNLENGVYQQMKYSSGDWTCYFEFKSNVDPSWYNKFFNNQGSNNHLLPSSDEINEKIRQASKGDQIYIKGKLVDYYIESKEGQSSSRSTSITRTDEGNGACEIVYIEDFQILERANSFYVNLFHYSKYLILISLLILIVLAFAIPVEV